MKLVKIIFFLSVSFNQIKGDDHNHYDITVLPMNLWGWLNKSNMEILPSLLQQSKARVVVELGSWLGAFTSFIANHTDEKTKIYAIDVWVETPECTEAMQLSKQQAEAFYAILYQQFLSNMIHLRLTDKVIPVKMSTVDAAQLSIEPDLVYVDASHAENDVYQDISLWYPKLKIGGIMCGDDWGWPSVRSAVNRISKELQQTIHFFGNLWWFDPKI